MCIRDSCSGLLCLLLFLFLRVVCVETAPVVAGAESSAMGRDVDWKRLKTRRRSDRLYAATPQELEEEQEVYWKISKIAIAILRHYYNPLEVGMTSAGYVRTATLAMNDRYMRNHDCGQLMEDRVDREKILIRCMEWENAQTLKKEGKTRFHITTEGNGDTWVKACQGQSGEVAKHMSDDAAGETFNPEHPLWTDVIYHGTVR